jgi:DNA repair photolyase
MIASYEYALSISSQFPFCGIPLRLDTYSDCQFACRYCFAASRGGATAKRPMQMADPQIFRRRMKRVSSGRASSAVDEMLVQRIPIHFGGLSDPFSPLELQHRRTLAFLEVLYEYKYPTILSTKGDAVVHKDYVKLLQEKNFLVQISISINDDILSSEIDRGAPVTSRRIENLNQLSAANVQTAVRMQPLIPSLEASAFELLLRVANAGAKHVSVEYLKLPVEHEWGHRDRLSSAMGFDLSKFYSESSSVRMGREWVLPFIWRCG